MKYCIGAVLAFIAIVGNGQPLRDINFNYVYDPTQPVEITIRILKTASGFTGLYHIQWKDSTHQCTTKLELRGAFSDKSGSRVLPKAEERGAGSVRGSIDVSSTAASQLLTVTVVDENTKQAWIDFRILEPAYPGTGILVSNGREILRPYITLDSEVSYRGATSSPMTTYYNDKFPSAAPPFSETQARVSKHIRADSVFMISSDSSTRFSKTGLYLFQQDTASGEALAVRVENDYPRFARVQSLAEPMIYICTKQEFDKIRAAQGDKKAFDRVILGLTGDADRARSLMRSYFRRVDLANQYFTSYKEGWKTDRGMIYIIFGLPDKVYRFADREVWHYENDEYKVTFNFARSGTIFDPDNFVLIRQKKYQQTWYEVIDLWRNARF